MDETTTLSKDVGAHQISQLGAEMEILTKNSPLNSILLKVFGLC